MKILHFNIQGFKVEARLQGPPAKSKFLAVTIHNLIKKRNRDIHCCSLPKNLHDLIVRFSDKSIEFLIELIE